MDSSVYPIKGVKYVTPIDGDWWEQLVLIMFIATH